MKDGAGKQRNGLKIIFAGPPAIPPCHPCEALSATKGAAETYVKHKRENVSLSKSQLSLSSLPKHFSVVKKKKKKDVTIQSDIKFPMRLSLANTITFLRFSVSQHLTCSSCYFQLLEAGMWVTTLVPAVVMNRE